MLGGMSVWDGGVETTVRRGRRRVSDRHFRGQFWGGVRIVSDKVLQVNTREFSRELKHKKNCFPLSVAVFVGLIKGFCSLAAVCSVFS